MNTASDSPTTKPAPARDGVPQAVATSTSYAVHKPTRLGPGSRVGRYEIESEIGHGGMGVVFGALDRKLGRPAALKLLRALPAGSRAVHRGRERLLREAQALARIRHPNIVSLYDVGDSRGGMYLAMERLEGRSLRHWLRGETHDWREILRVFIQSGRGLAAAHRAGVVHRDFKPSNVHICDDGRVVVLDFGLALASGGPDAPQAGAPSTSDDVLYERLTDVGVILGTTGYMSPEQLLRNEAGPWSDQFAFCVALFEALYGHRPYPGDTALAVARAFTDGDYIEPERTRVPRRIERALRRGLAISPEDRWPSIDALLSELARDPRALFKSVGRSAALVSGALAAAIAAAWVHGALEARAATPEPPPACTSPAQPPSP